MNVRDQLAAALAETWRAGTGFVVQPSGPPKTDWGVFADDLLPVIQRIVAEAVAGELRTIADDIRARFGWAGGYGKQLRDRADETDPT